MHPWSPVKKTGNMSFRELQEVVARSIISANHWLRSIESFTFLWESVLINLLPATRAREKICIEDFLPVLSACHMEIATSFREKESNSGVSNFRLYQNG